MKNKLAIIFSVAMVLALASVWLSLVAVAATKYPVRGDANGDGAVTMADAIVVERHILYNEPVCFGADANSDGVVNIGDVTKITRFLLKQDAIPGDVNGDGVITHADLYAIYPMILGTQVASKGADANEDGVIDMSDVIAIEGMLIYVP
jgi:hypothetical protein